MWALACVVERFAFQVNPVQSRLRRLLAGLTIMHHLPDCRPAPVLRQDQRQVGGFADGECDFLCELRACAQQSSKIWRFFLEIACPRPYNY